MRKFRLLWYLTEIEQYGKLPQLNFFQQNRYNDLHRRLLNWLILEIPYTQQWWTKLTVSEIKEYIQTHPDYVVASQLHAVMPDGNISRYNLIPIFDIITKYREDSLVIETMHRNLLASIYQVASNL